MGQPRLKPITNNKILCHGVNQNGKHRGKEKYSCNNNGSDQIFIP